MASAFTAIVDGREYADSYSDYEWGWKSPLELGLATPYLKTAARGVTKLVGVLQMTYEDQAVIVGAVMLHAIVAFLRVCCYQQAVDDGIERLLERLGKDKP